VGTILQICQFELPVFIYKLMCEGLLWISVSYGFCEFNRVASWNKGKNIILVRLSFNLCQLGIYWFHIQRKRMSHVNMSVPKIISKETLVLMFLSIFCFCNFCELKNNWWAPRHLLCEKILNYLGCVEVRIIVEKWNIYEALVFRKSSVQTCWLETTTLCLNTLLSENKNFQILIFIEI